jgi:hypothetical protein
MYSSKCKTLPYRSQDAALQPLKQLNHIYPIIPAPTSTPTHLNFHDVTDNSRERQAERDPFGVTSRSPFDPLQLQPELSFVGVRKVVITKTAKDNQGQGQVQSQGRSS